MEIEIERLGDNGEGIGRIPSGDDAGKVCFVDLALPQENVIVDVFENTNKYCKAKLIKLLNESSDRTKPICKYFSQCGGCTLQHLKYEKQCEFKKQKILSSFQRIAKISPNISEVVTCDNFGYRNKMVFPVSDNFGQAVVGMFESNSHRVVGIQKCQIASPEINNVLKCICEYLYANNDCVYKNNDLLLKYIVIRYVENATLVTFVLKDKFDCGEIYGFLKSKFDKIGLSIIISDNSKDILGGKYLHMYGLEKIPIEEFGIKYEIDNRSFYQVNTLVKHKLYDVILSEVNLNSIVIDGYSGAGLLTAILSQKCKQAIGVEINKSASRSAEDLKVKNGLNNVEFINNDFKKVIEKYLQNNKDLVIILDPPRAGCDKLIMDKISNCGAEKIIYVSCNPDSLARDVSRISDSFKITKVIPFEMFPQTKHVETLVVLKRKD